MIRTLLGSVGLALLLAVTACGASEEDQAAEAVAAGLMDENDETVEVTQEQADCVGEGFVDKLGVDKLTEYGILTEDLGASERSLDVRMDAQDAEAAAGVLVDCTDAARLLQDVMFAGADLTDDARACLDEALTDDAVKELFTASFAQDQERAAAAMAPAQECLAP